MRTSDETPDNLIVSCRIFNDYRQAALTICREKFSKRSVPPGLECLQQLKESIIKLAEQDVAVSKQFIHLSHSIVSLKRSLHWPHRLAHTGGTGPSRQPIESSDDDEPNETVDEEINTEKSLSTTSSETSALDWHQWSRASQDDVVLPNENTRKSTRTFDFNHSVEGQDFPIMNSDKMPAKTRSDYANLGSMSPTYSRKEYCLYKKYINCARSSSFSGPADALGQPATERVVYTASRWATTLPRRLPSSRSQPEGLHKRPNKPRPFHRVNKVYQQAASGGAQQPQRRRARGQFSMDSGFTESEESAPENLGIFV